MVDKIFEEARLRVRVRNTTHSKNVIVVYEATPKTISTLHQIDYNQAKNLLGTVNRLNKEEGI